MAGVLHAYIPDLPGKEKRKAAPGKEGLLGVEGMRPEVLLEALRRASAGRTVISISHRIYEQLGGRMIEIRALDGKTGEGEDLNPA